MNHHCKNCTAELNGNYCSNCGQPSDTHKLNFHYMWHDIQHGLLHFDKGIFYSIKELYTRPGNSIREFLEGKRVKHFKPLSMVIVLATIYAFLSHLLHLDQSAQISLQNNIGSGKGVDPMNISKWISDHYAISRLLSIPLLAFSTWLCFKRQKFNFVELLVLTAFVTAQALVLPILASPILYFLKDSLAFDFFNLGLQLVEFVLFAWTYIQFFNKISKLRAFFQAVLALLLYLVLLFLISAIIILIVGMLYFYN